MVIVFARSLVGLFIDEPATVEKAVQFVRIWFFCAPGMCFTNLFGSIFQAMGKWKHSLAISIIRQVVVLMPMLVIMNILVGEIGLVCAQPVADTVTLIAGIVLYIWVMKKQNVGV